MEQNGTNGATTLTDKQLQALPHLVTAPSMSEAARRADVGRTTLYRWIEDDEFRRELERQRNEALELAHVELLSLEIAFKLFLKMFDNWSHGKESFGSSY